jgi:hypothetical protein
MPVQWQQPPEQQAEALVQAALSLLRRNLAQPFSLTLLNIGATGFAAQQPAAGQQMPPVFARLLARGSTVAAPAAPQENGRVMAAVAIAQRRDYGASPQGLPLSKSGERQLAESGRSILQQPDAACQDAWDSEEEDYEPLRSEDPQQELPLPPNDQASQELADMQMAAALQREEFEAHQKRTAMLQVSAPRKKVARLNTLDAFVRRS